MQESGYESIRLAVYVRNLPAMRLCVSLAYFRSGQFRLAKGAFACFEKSMARIEC